MKIRVKLILLVIGVVLLMVAAYGMYTVLLSPVSRIESEENYLIILNDAIKDQLIEVNALPYAPLPSGQEFFASGSKGVDGAFKDLHNIKALPKYNKDIKSALDIIFSLQSLNDERLDKLRQDFDMLMGDAQKIFIFTDRVHLTDFYTVTIGPGKRPFPSLILPHVNNFMSDLGILQDSLNSSRDTIGEQYVLIKKEIGAIRTRALETAAAIVIGVIALTIAIALIFANGIAESIIRMERIIGKIKEGDISKRAVVVSSDEIGLLAKNLNLFLDELSASLYRIKAISKSNIEAKDKLAFAVVSATSSATQIESSTQSIGKRIENLNSCMNRSMVRPPWSRKRRPPLRRCSLRSIT